MHAYRTLVRIRRRRQEGLDRTLAEARAENGRLVRAAAAAAERMAAADGKAAEQLERIDRLTRSGNRFQIADYLAQQDYQGYLQEKAGIELAERDKAEAAVVQQSNLVSNAAKAAALNRVQQERLEEKMRHVLVQLDVASMDADDEEAEEAVVVRNRLSSETASNDAAASDHD